MGIGGRPGPGPIPKGAGGAGLPGQPPAPGFQPRGGGVRPTDPRAAGPWRRRRSPRPGRAVNPRQPAGIRRLGRSPGRAASNPRHADWYHGGWADSRGGTWDKGGSAAWDKAGLRARGEGAGLRGRLGLGPRRLGRRLRLRLRLHRLRLRLQLGLRHRLQLGYGTGSGDTYANTSSDASSTDSDSSRTDAAQETRSDGQQDGAAAEQGYQTFDRARDAFKAGDYAAALDLTDEALKDVPGDPLVHEFKALVLFARGEDARAAAELHAVLAVRPGMDWTTLERALPGRRDLHRPVAGAGGPLPAGPEGRGAPLRPGLPLPGRRAQRRGRGAAQGGARPGARRPGGPPPPRVADRRPPGAARADRLEPCPTGTGPPADPRRSTSSAAGGASATGRRST